MCVAIGGKVNAVTFGTGSGGTLAGMCNVRAMMMLGSY